jgi:hypothetical protein
METELGAWVLDEFCLMIGRRVENNLNNGKQAFDGFNDVSLPRQGYRSAKNLAKKKVRINPDGTW